MGAHLLVFVGVAAIVILLPGPDTAVVTKNVLLHGRRAALGASAGVGAGLSIWTLAAAVGLASVIRASEVAFTVLKVVGALYLMWLGFQALRAARHAPSDDEARLTTARPAMGARGGFWQGFFSDLANPKIGIFFTSLLPQFVDPGRPVLLPFMALGAVFVSVPAGRHRSQRASTEGTIRPWPTARALIRRVVAPVTSRGPSCRSSNAGRSAGSAGPTSAMTAPPSTRERSPVTRRRPCVIASASGNGKTTLAQLAATRLGVPFVQLDALVHGPGWTETPSEVLRAQLLPVLAGDGG